MDAPTAWKQCFLHWPEAVPRKGILVTMFDEQIPFDGFAAGEELLIVDRRTPDSLGARRILLAYGQIAAIKLVDVVKLAAFESLGFRIPAKV